MSEISLTYSKFGNSIMHKLHNHKFQPTENSTVIVTSIHEALHICVFAFFMCVQVLVFMWVDSYFVQILYSAIPVYCIKLQEHVKLRISNF